MAPSAGQEAYKFAEGERVLCFHGPLIYEAKCLKFRVHPKENVNEYWVHYAGWNKNWDEWVPETRILKYNEANVARQKELQRSQKGAGPKKPKSGKSMSRMSGAKDSKSFDAKSEGSVNDPDSRSSTPILESRPKPKSERKGESPTSSQDGGSDVPSKRKGRTRPDNSSDKEVEFTNNVEVRIEIPKGLRTKLIDDKIMVVVQNKRVKLPAELTVDKILEMYVKSKGEQPTERIDLICESICCGIRDYFNTTFRIKLIYKEERSSVGEVLDNSDLPPSQICGAVHLLRLFVPIGSFLATAGIDEKGMDLVKEVLHNFLDYLETNAELFFNVNNYS